MKDIEKEVTKCTGEKREYIPPKLDVIIVEMEEGIAANSAAVTPSVTAGNADAVPTDWGTTNDTTLYPDL